MSVLPESGAAALLDYLELRIPGASLPGKLAADPLSAARSGGLKLRPAPHYSGLLDLREYGCDALVFLGCRNSGDHKVMVPDVGTKGFAEIQSTVRDVFDVDPLALETMRVDLAADMENNSVLWWKQRARFKRKIFGSRIYKPTAAVESGADVSEYLEMGRAKIETLYAGVRPNCVRVYDKKAAWLHEWKKLARLHRRGAAKIAAAERALKSVDPEQAERLAIELDAFEGPELPEFEQWTRDIYGRDLRGVEVLTRVERQIGGGRVPDRLATLGDFWKQATDFNPFSNLQVLPSDGSEDFEPIKAPLQRRGESTSDYILRCGWLLLSKTHGGAQFAAAALTQKDHNAGRLLSALAEVAAADPGPGSVTQEQVFETYRSSIQKQLAA